MRGSSIPDSFEFQELVWRSFQTMGWHFLASRPRMKHRLPEQRNRILVDAWFDLLFGQHLESSLPSLSLHLAFHNIFAQPDRARLASKVHKRQSIHLRCTTPYSSSLLPLASMTSADSNKSEDL